MEDVNKNDHIQDDLDHLTFNHPKSSVSNQQDNDSKIEYHRSITPAYICITFQKKKKGTNVGHNRRSSEISTGGSMDIPLERKKGHLFGRNVCRPDTRL